MAPQLAAILFWLIASVRALREIQLSVPEAVGVGTSATLGCRWALDVGETLYTVKWYHGAQEFFRFVPKELPNTRVFSQSGIDVDISRSGAQQVVLRRVTRPLAGRYRCEVSADAPFFHTIYKTGTMKVVDLPQSAPRVAAQKSWYSAGDMLRANCSAPVSNPPVNLTWLLNGDEVKGLDIPPHDKYGKLIKPAVTDTSFEDANRIIFSPWDAIAGYEDPVTGIIEPVINVDNMATTPAHNHNREQSFVSRSSEIENKLNTSTEVDKSNSPSAPFSQLVIRVQATHFQKGHLNVTCVARLYSVWSGNSTLLLDEERPQIAPVMGSRDTNAGSYSILREGGLALPFSLLLFRHWSLR